MKLSDLQEKKTLKLSDVEKEKKTLKLSDVEKEPGAAMPEEALPAREIVPPERESLFTVAQSKAVPTALGQKRPE